MHMDILSQYMITSCEGGHFNILFRYHKSGIEILFFSTGRHKILYPMEVVQVGIGSKDIAVLRI